MNEFCRRKGEQTGLNYSLLATPAEGLSGRFIRMDKKRYGVIPGVTDREYYTNSFHVPVYYPITAFEKIEKEAPYHALTPAGHITYVEMDGNPSDNLEAFMAVIRYMHDKGVGYGSVNHPVDRDPGLRLCRHHRRRMPPLRPQGGRTHSAGKTGGAAGRIPVYRKKVKETQNEQADGKTDGNRQGAWALSASAESPATSSAPWTSGTTPSALRRASGSSTGCRRKNKRALQRRPRGVLGAGGGAFRIRQWRRERKSAPAESLLSSCKSGFIQDRG